MVALDIPKAEIQHKSTMQQHVGMPDVPSNLLAWVTEIFGCSDEMGFDGYMQHWLACLGRFYCPLG